MLALPSASIIPIVLVWVYFIAGLLAGALSVIYCLCCGDGLNLLFCDACHTIGLDLLVRLVDTISEADGMAKDMEGGGGTDSRICDGFHETPLKAGELPADIMDKGNERTGRDGLIQGIDHHPGWTRDRVTPQPWMRPHSHRDAPERGGLARRGKGPKGLDKPLPIGCVSGQRFVQP